MECVTSKQRSHCLYCFRQKKKGRKCKTESRSQCTAYYHLTANDQSLKCSHTRLELLMEVLEHSEHLFLGSYSRIKWTSMWICVISISCILTIIDKPFAITPARLGALFLRLCLFIYFVTSSYLSYLIVSWDIFCWKVDSNHWWNLISENMEWGQVSSLN